MIKWWSKKSIRFKIVLILMITTALVSVSTLFSYYRSATVLKKTRSMFEDNVNLNYLISDMEEMLEVTEMCLLSDYYFMEDYVNIKYKVQDDIIFLPDDDSFDQDIMQKKNIKVLAKKFILTADQLVYGSSKNYDVTYEDLIQLNKLTYITIDKYLDKKFEYNASEHLSTLQQIDNYYLINAIVTEIVLLLSILLIFVFSKKITQPMINMSKFAEELSTNVFDAKELDVTYRDEIGITTEFLNKMMFNVREYIKQIEHAKEKELKLQNSLKQSEINLLQAQINPHFLYNILNVASQLAIQENADETGEFIVELSQLFRYNLSSLTRDVTLKDEIENVKRYIYLINTRFPNKYEFSICEDGRCEDLRMQSMILQPLVENAIQHGFVEGQKGHIKINIENGNNKVIVTVSDNGKGIDEDVIDDIINRRYDSATTSGTGIAVANIIDRLELYYQKKDILKIESGNKKGTKVILTLPYEKGE